MVRASSSGMSRPCSISQQIALRRNESNEESSCRVSKRPEKRSSELGGHPRGIPKKAEVCIPRWLV